MKAKHIQEIMEVYASIYESKHNPEMEEGEEKEEKEEYKGKKKGKKEKEEKESETVEEGFGEKAAEMLDKGTKKIQSSLEKMGVPINREKRGTVTKAEQEKRMKEEVDLFDYILEYLVAEGYADTNKAALAIMANMSEEWRSSIVEQLSPEQEGRRRELSKMINRAGTPTGMPLDSPQLRDMQGEFIRLQKLKGV